MILSIHFPLCERTDDLKAAAVGSLAVVAAGIVKEENDFVDGTIRRFPHVLRRKPLRNLDDNP